MAKNARKKDNRIYSQQNQQAVMYVHWTRWPAVLIRYGTVVA